jgi:DNA-binding transcriptional regulator YdaS (Cro superfamily)
MRDEPLARAIELAGGTAAVARELGCSSQAVSQWDRCPAERVIAVERACGRKVTRYELRPDLYPAEEASPREDSAEPQTSEGTAGEAA